METRWKDKTGKEKLITVAYVIVGMIALAFAVVDFAELWEYAHAGWVFAFAVLCGLECLQRWNTKPRGWSRFVFAAV